MQKIVAISQSNYIPWKGYFDMIARADEFIVYDEAQFTKNDWRNRNQIKTPSGLHWLTIPVHGSTSKKISDVVIADPRWRKKHLKTIHQFYKEASCYKEIAPWVTELYKNAKYELLSDVNVFFINEINRFLGINTTIFQSSDFALKGSATQKVVSICKELDADVYLSGPTAKNYLDLSLFNRSGIKISWNDYSNYSEYSQLYGPFEHRVSILDLILNTGKNAKSFLKNSDD